MTAAAAIPVAKQLATAVTPDAVRSSAAGAIAFHWGARRTLAMIVASVATADGFVGMEAAATTVVAPALAIQVAAQ